MTPADLWMLTVIGGMAIGVVGLARMGRTPLTTADTLYWGAFGAYVGLLMVRIVGGLS